MRLAYGKDNAPAPVIKDYKITPDKITVCFDQEVIMNNSELVGVEGLYFVCRREGETPFAGPDSLHIKTKGSVTGQNTIEVEIPLQVKESGYPIKELRYLWTNCPEFVTLYGKSGLPVMPFIIKT